ncbi:hypothetical protein FE257_007355 [Aspergillus nanangensis]|uniref:DUF1996 domain-containing protein n=1 Tax=Aspergillus nanangensis TaxID=2582783 RepID=A0AAD4GVG8_ASPNN|nr:hypothetical protein FE257_007355 [Aspergillus nanangensis]
MHGFKTLSALSVLLSLVDAQPEFNFACASLTIQRSDPIVNPDAPGGHTHAIIGGTSFSRLMSPDVAPTSKETTCAVDIDRSNYWQPLLYHIRPDGKFEGVPFQGSAAYYLSRACDYAPGKTTCDPSALPQAPPKGLRMVTGNPFLRTYNDTFEMRAQSHTCLVDNGPSSYTQALPTQACVRMRAQTFFPSCWDGKNLDSSDHKSHMAFPAIGDYNGGVCPESHPTAIISIFLEFFYDTSSFQDWENLVYAMGDRTGYGLHGDFVNGWTDLTALGNAMKTCSGPDFSLNSPGCSITQGKTISATARDLENAAPVEDLGLEEPLVALPGNNPVTGSASDRVN